MAAKCIAKKSITSEKVKMKLLGEIKVHKSMDHPNIVRQRDCFEDDINVYMILDICTNGTLMEMLKNRKRFSEPEVRYFGLQILGAAKYMHSRRVIHRDLKLGNLFLDENMCIKVGDFGLAALLVDDHDRKKTICGTPNYIAPEVLFGSAEGHSYEVDLWSIGVIFYAMLVGKPPFQSKDVKAIYAKIKSNEYEFPISAEVSNHARSLITSLLSTNPDTRPSIDDIANHDFFNTGIMPRCIPVSAVRVEPQWPEGQASSVFKRNLNYVTINAGIGQDQIAGREQGKVVDVKVERPEMGRYLPVSLSPRTGPAAKMVNLKSERAGGRTETLSDRLQSVKLDEQNLESPAKSQQALGEARIPEARATLGAGALRKQSIQCDKIGYQAPLTNDDVPMPRLKGPTRAVSQSTLQETARMSSRLRGATRVVSEPTRPITRSSRFTQAQNLVRANSETTEVQATTLLSRPIRRTMSANVPPDSYESEVTDRMDSRAASKCEDGLKSRPASRLSRNQTSPASKGVRSSTSTDVSPDTTELVRRPISRVTSVEPSVVATRSQRVTRGAASNSASNSIWTSIAVLADHLEDALSSKVKSRRQSDASPSMEVIHVSKWVDYSHRYGLGYQLSNESTGVYFNDATSLILPNHATELDFISASGSRSRHQVEAASKELSKKVYLLKHFKGYMTTHLNNAASQALPHIDGDEGESICYMTHYWRTKAGILFRLSDGTIQLNFTDHSKLMIPDKTKQQCLIRFVDVDKNTTTSSLDHAMQSKECREKLECAAKILHKFAKLEGRGSEDV